MSSTDEPVVPTGDLPDAATDEGGRINQALAHSLSGGELGSRAWLDRGKAHDADKEVQQATRVAGEEALEADQQRRAIEAEMSSARGARTARSTDLDDALERAEKLADEAIAASLDADEAAADGIEHDRLFHHSAEKVGQDASRAIADESKAAQDLVQLDQIEKEINGEIGNSPTR